MEFNKTFIVLKNRPTGASLNIGDIVMLMPNSEYKSLYSTNPNANAVHWIILRKYLEEITLSKVEKLIYNIRD